MLLSLHAHNLKVVLDESRRRIDEGAWQFAGGRGEDQRYDFALDVTFSSKYFRRHVRSRPPKAHTGRHRGGRLNGVGTLTGRRQRHHSYRHLRRALGAAGHEMSEKEPVRQETAHESGQNESTPSEGRSDTKLWSAAQSLGDRWLVYR